MNDRLGDGPIQQRFRDQMIAIASVLDETFNGTARGPDKNVGFVLLVFPYGNTEGSRCNFISNGAARKDVVALMKEMIARFEGQPEISGQA